MTRTQAQRRRWIRTASASIALSFLVITLIGPALGAFITL